MKIGTWISYVVATCCGVGYVPVMPGTAGSLVAVVVLFVLPPVSFGMYSMWLILGTVLAIYVAGVVERDSGVHDPSFVVIDEVVGMAIAVVGVTPLWWHYALAFALFRAFDIIKPFPICKIETWCPGGLGIVLDDVAAGLLSCGLMYLATMYLF